MQSPSSLTPDASIDNALQQIESLIGFAPLSDVLGSPPDIPPTKTRETLLRNEALRTGKCLFDSVTDLALYESGWQVCVHSGHRDTAITQQLPEELTNRVVRGQIDMPPLTDFPITTNVSNKVLPGMRPYWGFKLLRRCCFLVFYLPVDCPCGTNCSNVFCPFAHSIFEKMFHPLMYRTKICERGLRCPRNHCSFLHSDRDDLQASNFWLLWEAHWAGWRTATPNIEQYCRAVCVSPEEETRVLHGLFTAQRIRMERATPEELETLQLLQSVKADSLFSPFETRLSHQPLNVLYGFVVCPRVGPLLLAHFRSQGSEAMLVRVSMKLDQLQKHYDQILRDGQSKSRAIITGKQTQPPNTFQRPFAPRPDKKRMSMSAGQFGDDEQVFENLTRRVSDPTSDVGFRGALAEYVPAASHGVMQLQRGEFTYAMKVADRMGKLRTKVAKSQRARVFE